MGAIEWFARVCEVSSSVVPSTGLDPWHHRRIIQSQLAMYEESAPVEIVLAVEDIDAANNHVRQPETPQMPSIIKPGTEVKPVAPDATGVIKKDTAVGPIAPETSSQPPQNA